MYDWTDAVDNDSDQNVAVEEFVQILTEPMCEEAEQVEYVQHANVAIVSGPRHRCT